MFLLQGINSFGQTDTSAAASDSAVSTDQQENDFQSGLDTMFQSSYSIRDTFGWDTLHVSAKHFDSQNWKDTARLVLADSAAGMYYCQPFCNFITSDFGFRRWGWHYGVDVRLLKGDTVRSALNGTVRLIGYDRRGYGHVVVVRHMSGLETLYGHLSKVSVTQNQKIIAGEPIGLGGSTGHSTGSHLHFEMRFYGEPLNPNDIVDFTKCRLKSDTLVLTKANFEYLVDLRKAKYTYVRKGDTLGHIARRYHTTVTKLCQLNHIKPTTILSIGRKLRYQ